MIKKILELKGAQQLSKKEQNAIHGGDGLCPNLCEPGMGDCPPDGQCTYVSCNGYPNFGWVCIYPKGDH